MSRGPDASTLLERALMASAKASGVEIRSIGGDWERWASATFVGARHSIAVMAMAGPALDRWVSDLPELEVAMRGHLLADLAVARTARRDDAVMLTVEALTVEDC